MDMRSKAKIAVFPKGFMDQRIDRSMGLFEWIEQAGTLRADGLELHPLFLERTDKAYLRQVKEAAAKSNLKIPLMRTSPDFANPDPAHRAGELQKMKDMIDVMAFLGPSEFRSCRVLFGLHRPDVTREDGIRSTAAAIRELLPYAERNNVCLVIENHPAVGAGQQPEFELSSDRFLEMIGGVSSPSFGVGFNPSHAIASGEDPLKLLERVKHRLFTVNASDRYLPEGKGNSSDDLERDRAGRLSEQIFSLLRQARFRGWISVGDGANGLEETASSVRFLREKIGAYLPQ
ncbi:sugar phosphate isomerase/epimerase family protein [Paenibacillus hodogayensis]|uniref:Sugar phosphate isomerase/epimerase family protein n=1 Tax=Paenibacillus hodogayensis TaxID=279208 RepID=A0ABV5VQI2_9BACL